MYKSVPPSASLPFTRIRHWLETGCDLPTFFSKCHQGPKHEANALRSFEIAEKSEAIKIFVVVDVYVGVIVVVAIVVVDVGGGSCGCVV